MYLVAQALSHGLRDGRPNSSHKGRSEGKGRRNERLSVRSGQMEACGETQNAIMWNVNVEFVRVTAPATEKLNFVICISNGSGSRSGSPAEAVTSELRRVDAKRRETLFECGDESGTCERGAVGIREKGSVEWLRINGEKVLKCRNSASRRTCGCLGNQNRNTFAKRVSF